METACIADSRRVVMHFCGDSALRSSVAYRWISRSSMSPTFPVVKSATRLCLSGTAAMSESPRLIMLAGPVPYLTRSCATYLPALCATTWSRSLLRATMRFVQEQIPHESNSHTDYCAFFDRHCSGSTASEPIRRPATASAHELFPRRLDCFGDLKDQPQRKRCAVHVKRAWRLGYGRLLPRNQNFHQVRLGHGE